MMENEGNSVIPYGRQSIKAEDLDAVVEALQSDWITTGPLVDKFERAISELVCAGHGVAVSNGTAALHAIMSVIGIESGDEVIVPAITFLATANAVVYQSGIPKFADVQASNLLIDPVDVERKIGPKTKAIVAVDYAGQPANYLELRQIANEHGLVLIADACHSIGGSCSEGKVGSLADLSAFSFHPVKHITTGEGGMVTTSNSEYVGRLKSFRNHGIDTSARERQAVGSTHYEMTDLGYNYRITDFQCALGLSQLNKLTTWVARRQLIAKMYDEAFGESEFIEPLKSRTDVVHTYHLYVVRVVFTQLKISRRDLIRILREKGIITTIHYLPVYLHKFYRNRYGTVAGQCKLAEQAYEEILSLPMFPLLTDDQVHRICEVIIDVLSKSVTTGVIKQK